MDIEILMLVIIYTSTLLKHCGRPRGHIYHLLVSKTSSFQYSRIKVQLIPRVCHSGLETRKTICVHRSNQDPGIVFRFPINLLSIQVFVIIIEKGVKGFTLLKVIPLAYASYGM